MGKNISSSTIFLFLLFWIQSITLIEASDKFRFAYYENELYVNRRKYTYPRGYQTIYGLLQLQFLNIPLPNVYARIDGIDSDNEGNSELTFWRQKGTNISLLWPEFDYWGSVDTWSSPYPLYAKAMKEQRIEIPWNHRQDAIYWAGALNRKVRESFVNCSSQYPHNIVANVIDWPSIRHQPQYGSLSNVANMKPIRMDSHNQMKYKYGIYFNGYRWSTSLKRMISSGAILIMPKDNIYETMMTDLLERKCPDCYLIYNESFSSDELCDHLINIVYKGMKTKHDQKYQYIAEKLSNFTEKYYSLNYTLKYMIKNLSLLEKQQSKDSVKEYIDSNHMERVDCATLHHDYKPDTRMKWLLGEWYDEDCRLNLNSTYLTYTAM